MPTLSPPSALAAVLGHLRAVRHHVIVRQTFQVRADALWHPTEHPWRWNVTSRALYTSLALHVALAERLSHTPGRSLLTVGIADAMIARTLDLTAAIVLRVLGFQYGDLIQPSYRLTQALGEALVGAGVGGLLVPAALERTARLFPSFALIRNERRTVYPTPRTGTNLVLFPDALQSRDRYPEIERFSVVLEGLGASS